MAEEPVPYWTEDVAIGEGHFWREDYTIRLKAHVSTERYREREILCPDVQLAGERIYVHAKPYVLVPDITLTVALHPEPTEVGAIGEVASSDWVGMRHIEVGNAQAWHYPADHTLILWECYPSQLTGEHPREDTTWRALWTGFERFLLERLSGVQRIVTPASDPGYDRAVWHDFLRSLGYDELSPAAFVKAAGLETDMPGV